jgi:hypothetical protein
MAEGMSISMRLGVDRNNNGMIEPEDVVKNLSELSEKDGDRNDVISGREREGIFFEYTKDSFIPADREHREKKDGFLTTTELRSIDRKKGTMDVRININGG